MSAGYGGPSSRAGRGVELLSTEWLNGPTFRGLVSSTVDGECYAKEFDSRGIEMNVAATPATLYGVWSSPQPMTVLAIVQLTEERVTLG